MSSPEKEVDDAILKTSKLFNRLRSPQALTKVIFVSSEIVTVEFSGSLCYECGDVEKYVEEFQKDFKVFVDFIELVAGKAKETATHAFQVNFFVRVR
jgi:hypothetical protein